MLKRNEARLILARTIYGEARGEGYRGMCAVANVVINRTLLGGWYGAGVIGVATKPRQFSAWNPDDPNRAVIAGLKPGTGNAVFDEAIEIAGRAMDGDLPDITGGATHYHAVGVSPDWAGACVETARIGAHVFYREV